MASSFRSRMEKRVARLEYVVNELNDMVHEMEARRIARTGRPLGPTRAKRLMMDEVRVMMKDGSVSAAVVHHHLECSRTTLYDIKRRLGIRSFRRDGQWWWEGPVVDKAPVVSMVDSEDADDLSSE